MHKDLDKTQLSIFIPDSFLSETKDLKLKTSKIGLIGRAAAVFNVDKIVIYKDNNDDNKGESSKKEAEFISTILSYMDTPQYLRKKAFPIQKELMHIGIVPPLRTPHHPTEHGELGDYRKGFTVKRTKKGTYVDIGIDELALCKEQLSVNKIFSFKIIKIAKEVIVEPDSPTGVYWGYETVATNKNIKKSLNLINPDLVISTSKNAPDISNISDDIENAIHSIKSDSKQLAILFGGPYSSISDDIESPNWNLIKVNTIPNQGTKTVRTEEAVFATLSIFNMIFLS
ncbi:MAG: putative RNA uridine N3 methyltransferase [Methanobacteriaceae archaeon]